MIVDCLMRMEEMGMSCVAGVILMMMKMIVVVTEVIVLGLLLLLMMMMVHHSGWHVAQFVGQQISFFLQGGAGLLLMLLTIDSRIDDDGI